MIDIIDLIKAERDELRPARAARERDSQSKEHKHA